MCCRGHTRYTEARGLDTTSSPGSSRDSNFESREDPGDEVGQLGPGPCRMTTILWHLHGFRPWILKRRLLLLLELRVNGVYKSVFTCSENDRQQMDHCGFSDRAGYSRDSNSLFECFNKTTSARKR